MKSSHRFSRPPAAAGALVAAVLLATAPGCALTDAKTPVAVPDPAAGDAPYCRALHRELPDAVAGLRRSATEPPSELTAAWGDGAIVLRCGVPRPAAMSDPQAQAIGVDGVDWLVEPRKGTGPRFTTTYREAYVELSLDGRFTYDGGPLTAFAGPVGRTVPRTL
ncbi:DUF3515 domain-containing protein [Streptomyces somaliensis]|uniref:DUF3515 domain-containing protein n=1 Tax=Streptomyces somaliensis TaxID=78355 RepID=UPI0020CCECC1|nr:DUF3515 domain-containing protein [Streptomyces somaliensis]MCP9944463.1 DUF3515 domain-containing protein [Streptomyces somaliensis]MCP9962308.1 DUF3515 domain-containing protein [Streptomyces somaliensis]MCP9975130.1 DUF3515 domain-containing protein [Streptomyces somaliensis]